MILKKDFNEKNLRRILQQAINFSIDIKSEYCTSDHLIYCILRNINNEEKYDYFRKKYSLDRLLEELKFTIVQNYSNVENFSGTSILTNYIIELIYKKINNLIKNNVDVIDELDLLILFLYDENTLSPSNIDFFNLSSTNMSFSKIIIFSKFDEKEFLEDLQKIKKDFNEINKNNTIIELQNEIRNSSCVILNDLIKENKIDELIGREKEIFSIATTLCRRVKNNVILTGDPGVGKTSLVEGLALKIYKKEIYKKLHNFEIFSITVTDLIAGTKFRGDLEEKIKKLIDNILKYSEQKDIIPVLFIDEIHMIINSGTSVENKVDIANMLKPILQKGRLRIIGATTHEEFRAIQKDNALKRRFQKIHIEEPSVEETKLILKGLINYYESFHKVKFDEKALEEIPYLAKKYITTSFLPDSAIDLIDITASKLKLLNQNEEILTIKLNDIIEVLSEITKTPVEKITLFDSSSNDNKNKFLHLKNLSSNIKNKLFGQDEAVDTVVSTILTAKAGLRDENKPEAIFLLNGPTGTGKTELCKILADELNIKFLRIDMSEFMEQHSVSKLIGAPPGYVGYNDTEGILISNIEKNPNCLILFDEIEKAHSSVLNLFLQIFDYGKLTGSTNKVVKFNNTIIMMTSNLGNTVYDDKKIGFIQNDHSSFVKEQQEAISKYFSPEFRNRIDNIIIFNRLGEETCKKIIQKFINELQEKVNDKKVQIKIDEKVVKYLLEKGFDEKMGARPLARIINKKIKEKLAPEILYGFLVNGGEALFTVKDNDVVLVDPNNK